MYIIKNMSSFLNFHSPSITKLNDSEHNITKLNDKQTLHNKNYYITWPTTHKQSNTDYCKWYSKFWKLWTTNLPTVAKICNIHFICKSTRVFSVLQQIENAQNWRADMKSRWVYENSDSDKIIKLLLEIAKSVQTLDKIMN